MLLIIHSYLNCIVHRIYTFFFSYEAAKAKNYSSGELEAVIRSASSFALVRKLRNEDKEIKLTMEDFIKALDEVVPANDLERYRYSLNLPCTNQQICFQL